MEKKWWKKKITPNDGITKTHGHIKGTPHFSRAYSEEKRKGFRLSKNAMFKAIYQYMRNIFKKPFSYSKRIYSVQKRKLADHKQNKPIISLFHRQDLFNTVWNILSFLSRQIFYKGSSSKSLSNNGKITPCFFFTTSLCSNNHWYCNYFFVSPS